MIQQYGQAKAEEIIEYSYNNSTDPTKPVIPPSQRPTTISQRPTTISQRPTTISQRPPVIQRPNSAPVNQITNVNKYSPAYARIIGAKPKAAKSANIRLGGLF